MSGMLLGAHESVSGGLHLVFARAEEDGCRVVQLFTRSGRRWEAPPLGEQEIAAFVEARRASSVQLVVAHCSYLINLAAADEVVRQKSQRAIAQELDRCTALGIPLLVLHPGSVADGEEVEVGIARVARSLDALLVAHPGSPATICLENTAGQGNSVGHRLEHLRWIIDAMAHGARLGICLDTAHFFAAGYDLRSEEGYARTWASYAEELGWERLRVLHLNDALKGLGSRIDRHAHIGEGELGLATFRRLLTDGRFAGLPGILETPVDFTRPTPYQEELRLLRRLAAGG